MQLENHAEPDTDKQSLPRHKREEDVAWRQRVREEDQAFRSAAREADQVLRQRESHLNTRRHALTAAAQASAAGSTPEQIMELAKVFEGWIEQ
jgi:hypothetical protein